MSYRWTDWNGVVIILIVFTNLIASRLPQGRWQNICTGINLLVTVLGGAYIFWFIAHS